MQKTKDNTKPYTCNHQFPKLTPHIMFKNWYNSTNYKNSEKCCNFLISVTYYLSIYHGNMAEIAKNYPQKVNSGKMAIWQFLPLGGIFLGKL